MSLNETPHANRLHIGIFGKRNSGKSSLINAITKQETAIISNTPGTTTDPVSKAMEIPKIGACLLIDTAGIDDVGSLGTLRVNKTMKALEKCDVLILVCSDTELSQELSWFEKFKDKKVIVVVNKADVLDAKPTINAARTAFNQEPIVVSALTRQNIDKLVSTISEVAPKDAAKESLAGHLVDAGDIVLLVMPQDIQAPKGRLILPQVQTIRDLLDHHCVVMSTTTDQYLNALSALKQQPSLIITDSQVFDYVYEHKPKESALTSFSVLMAALKGDIEVFVQGAAIIDTLSADSRVLIAEACTHIPLTEDIGRVKIPRLLKQKCHEDIHIDIVNGHDFPQDLKQYDLIIHCGACMFNRQHVLTRIEKAVAQNVPITNYGIALAKFSNILDKISY